MPGVANPTMAEMCTSYDVKHSLKRRSPILCATSQDGDVFRHLYLALPMSVAAEDEQTGMGLVVHHSSHGIARCLAGKVRKIVVVGVSALVPRCLLEWGNMG